MAPVLEPVSRSDRRFWSTALTRNLLRPSDAQVQEPGPPPKTRPFGWDTTLKLVVGIDERSFDGEYYYSGNGARHNQAHDPLLIIEPFERVESQISEASHPEFLGYAGIAFPRNGSELKRPPSSSILRLLETPAFC